MIWGMWSTSASPRLWRPGRSGGSCETSARCSWLGRPRLFRVCVWQGRPGAGARLWVVLITLEINQSLTVAVETARLGFAASSSRWLLHFINLRGGAGGSRGECGACRCSPRGRGSRWPEADSSPSSKPLCWARSSASTGHKARAGLRVRCSWGQGGMGQTGEPGLSAALGRNRGLRSSQRHGAAGLWGWCKLRAWPGAVVCICTPPSQGHACARLSHACPEHARIRGCMCECAAGRRNQPFCQGSCGHRHAEPSPSCSPQSGALSAPLSCTGQD